ncbi:OmpP1/FadL family transporter (plasmid) [Legionella sp. D16C41]|uniref:OmpP1/FadL family transporter n=1 Tax=Legionella sp. D16C41 TaxID=3402688 RepID=UPI003AF5B003
MKKYIILTFSFLISFSLHASFIEATMGTAVVNDATSTYHNPAAMFLLKKPELVALGTKAISHQTFRGQTIVNKTIQSGIAREHTDYKLPSLYFVIPIKNSLRLGFATLVDNFSSDNDEPSVLRYIQANNHIKNIDYLTSIGFKIKEHFFIGGGLNYSSARFVSDPIIGFPNSDMPDSQSHNVSKAQQFGFNVGFMSNFFKSTLIGFNYRSVMPYQFYGKSYFLGPPPLVSPHYHFNFWTPAKSVLTLSHAISQDVRFIGTVQLINWHIFKTITLNNLATRIGSKSVIIPAANVPYHFHDSFIVTLGAIRSFSSKFILRVAGNYLQSPGNSKYRITTGDSFIIGSSVGYKFNDYLTMDIGYSHAFIKDKFSNIVSRINQITGTNSAYRDAISLKFTLISDYKN